MLTALKRLFSSPAVSAEPGALADWALKQGHHYKRVRGGVGFVVDGEHNGLPWRMEWGPPQRDYIPGQELRLRMELDLPYDMQMLLVTAPLMDQLEKRTFEEFTDKVRTQIGTQTPEEMRWLVMFPKLNLSAHKDLRPHFGGVSNSVPCGQAWIDGVLAQRLARASIDWLRDEPPFVLMTLRGRVYLRLHLDEPSVHVVDATLRLFEAAVAQALRAADVSAERHADPVTSGNTAWQSLQPPPPPNPPAPRRPHDAPKQAD